MRAVATEVELSLRGHILIVPGSGGLTALGELCVDALVSTFQLRRAAIVESRHLLPVAMACAWLPPSKSGEVLALTTAAEVYQSQEVPNLSVLQLRSPTVEGKRGAMAREIWSWACQMGVAEMIIVGASSSHTKVDADLAASTNLRFVCSGYGPDSPTPDFGTEVLPFSHAVQAEEGENADMMAIHRFLRGGGLARNLLLTAFDPERDGSSPSALCLLGLTSEALDMMQVELISRAASSCVAGKLGVAAPELRRPLSWQCAVTSPEAAQHLWG